MLLNSDKLKFKSCRSKKRFPFNPPITEFGQNLIIEIYKLLVTVVLLSKAFCRIKNVSQRSSSYWQFYYFILQWFAAVLIDKFSKIFQVLKPQCTQFWKKHHCISSWSVRFHFDEDKKGQKRSSDKEQIFNSFFTLPFIHSFVAFIQFSLHF